MKKWIYVATTGSAFSEGQVMYPITPETSSKGKEVYSSEWELVAAIHTEKGVIWYWKLEDS